MGNKAMKEIQANPGAFSGDGEVNAGRILGIIGTAMLAIGFLLPAIGLIGLPVYSDEMWNASFTVSEVKDRSRRAPAR